MIPHVALGSEIWGNTMEYKGFISTLIERSEMLLPLDRRDDLNVTTLLLLLNTGFALVRDRIQHWDNTDDSRIRVSDPWRRIRNACKTRLGKPITMNGRVFFDDFRTSQDWAYLRVPKEASKGPLSAHNVVKCLGSADEYPSDRLELEELMRALRNSFAHGGVLPMSSSQAGPRQKRVGTYLHDARQIDRVYFVSKWIGDSIQDDRGWIVMEFGLDALWAFWQDWKALILVPGQHALDELERVA